MSRPNPVTRRRFVGSAGAVGLPLLTSRKAVAHPATPPSARTEKINIAEHRRRRSEPRIQVRLGQLRRALANES